MGSKHTTLIVSNLRNVNIDQITTTVASNSDWDGDSRPDHNFNHIALTKYNANGQREELNDPAFGSLKDGKFTMHIHYVDGKTISVTNNQKDAITKFRRVIAKNDGIEICQTSGGDSNGFEIRDSIAPDNANWMRDLLKRKPNARLNDITMPGSHDAGMYTVTETFAPASAEVTQTQDDPFLKQLRAGSRYFDVRIWLNHDEYYTYHGSTPLGVKFVGCQGGKLSDILNDVNQFIEQHGKNETVILRISHTYDNVDKWKLLNYLLDHCKHVYKTNQAIPYAELPLSATQGKVLLVFDNGEYAPYIDPSRGVLPYRDWNHIEYGFKVFDEYSDTDKYNEMKDGQLKHLSEHGGYGHNYLFLLSWTLTGKVGGILDLGVLSSLARPWLPEYLERMKKGEIKKANIVYIDFLDPWVCSAIISVND